MTEAFNLSCSNKIHTHPTVNKYDDEKCQSFFLPGHTAQRNKKRWSKVTAKFFVILTLLSISLLFQPIKLDVGWVHILCKYQMHPGKLKKSRWLINYHDFFQPQPFVGHSHEDADEEKSLKKNTKEPIISGASNVNKLESFIYFTFVWYIYKAILILWQWIYYRHLEWKWCRIQSFHVNLIL